MPKVRGGSSPTPNHGHVRPPWLVALKGLPGVGKTTLARELASSLGWPLLDHNDIKDALEASAAGVPGRASYELLFKLAGRQLLLGLSVFCDSPLISAGLYGLARRTAAEAGARVGVIECCLVDEAVHRRRLEARQGLHRPEGRLTTWEQLLTFRDRHSATASYPIDAPHLVVDASKPLPEQVADSLSWLGLNST
jgi:predicted kinase